MIEKTSPVKETKFLPYKFTGKERDEDTGLYYYGARYLDPKYSRWLSADPALGEYMGGTSSGEGGIFNTINFNLYHYAGNNPIKYIDPDGREEALSSLLYLEDGTGKKSLGLMPISSSAASNTAQAVPDQSAQANASSGKASMGLPIEGIVRVTSEFGKRERLNTSAGRTNEGHGGIDFGAAEGTNVLSAIDGTVLDIGSEDDGYGNYLVVGDGKGWSGTLTYYAHLKDAPSVKKGDTVEKGQKIGQVGSTGKSTGPHLHFEVRTEYGHKKHDPREYLPLPEKQE